MKSQLIQSIPTEGLKNGTHLDAEVYYCKGGQSFLSGSYTPRGYYVSVKPVKHGNGMTSFTLFTGVSQLLLETGRYSEKQFKRAVAMSEAVIPGLIERVLEKERAA